MRFNRPTYMNNIQLFKINNVLILAFAILGGIGLNRILGLWANPTTHVLGLLVGISLFVGIIIKPEVAIWGLVILRSIAGPFMQATTVFPGALNINISGILNLLVIFAGMYYIVTKKVNLLELPISKPYSLFMAICFATTLIAPDKITAIRYCVRFLSYFMLYVVTITVLQNKKQIVNLIHIIFLSAIIPLSVGFYQFFMGTGSMAISSFNRIFATFGHPVPYGFYLMLLLVIAIVLFLYYSNIGPQKIGWGIICLAMGASLLQTFTRGAWIGLIIALIVIGFRYKRVWVFLPLLLIALVALITSISERLADISEPISEQSSSLSWRVNLWKEAFPMIKSNPIGNGLGSFVLYSSLKIKDQLSGAHNVYLRLAMETGLLGLGAYLWLMFALGKEAIKNYISLSDGYFKMLNLGFISILAAYVIASIGDNHLEYIAFQWYFWLFAGIVEAGKRIEFRSLINE